MKPYKETENGNIIRRTFSDNVPESELVWHRDHEDRVVLPLNENDWMVQFDNKLPTKLNVGEEYFIPKDTFHRVIKGSGELQVEIIKTDFDEIIEEAEKKAKRDACYHKVRARYDVWPSAYASGALVKCRKVGASNWGNSSNEGEEFSSKSINEDVFLANAMQINNIVTRTHSKQIYSLLLGMFPNAKEIIDYHFNDELGQPFAEWRRLIFEIDNYVLTGPTFVNPQKIELDDETMTDRQTKYDQYIKDKDAGKQAMYFRDNNADPRNIDFSKLPPVTLMDTGGGNYELVDGAHRIFLAKKANKQLKAYIWKKQKNTHPNVAKIKALFDGIGNNVTEELTVYEAKKTDFSKEKSQGLHGWFSRKGGEGSSGWVDCNTCRKDPDTGRKKCKPCGRQDGEKRKYPACRPTPSSCGTRGKGKKWGKKSTSEGLNISENFSIFDKNYLKMRLQETFNYEEPLVLPAEPKTIPKESPAIQPSRRNKPFLPERETQPDPKANV